MAHEAHAHDAHDNAGVLGGLLDLTAVGLGIGMGVGGLFALAGKLSVPAWFGMAAVLAIIGAVIGSMWGGRRGY
jgi:hypothetical protein